MRHARFNAPQAEHPLTNGPLYVVFTEDGTGPFGAELCQVLFSHSRGDWFTAPQPPTRMNPTHGYRVTTAPWDMWAFADMRVYEVAIKGEALWFELDQAWYVESVKMLRPVPNPAWFGGAMAFVEDDLPSLDLFQPSPLGRVRSKQFQSSVSWLDAITKARRSVPDDIHVSTCAYLGRCTYNVRSAFRHDTRSTAHTLITYLARQAMERQVAAVDFLGGARRQISANMQTAASAMATLLIYDGLTTGEIDTELDTIRACWATVVSGYALVGVTKEGVPLVAAGPR